MRTILDEIFESTRERVERLKRLTDTRALYERARAFRSRSERSRFLSALRNPASINVIAEFKRASPSKGVINDERDPAETAKRYEAAGATAISVLTEEKYFRGSLDDLRSVRAVTSLPVVRKDFIYDEFQIYEAADAGADAVLLIVAYLDIKRMKALIRTIEDELGMDALVEVHTREEMKIAADLGARLIGVNNRDLKTFEVSLDVSRDLVEFAPHGVTLVTESGLKSREDVEQLHRLGYSGFLVGEALMTSDDPGTALARFIGHASALPVK
jgi:indole-3-glycerol phosphate synthase